MIFVPLTLRFDDHQRHFPSADSHRSEQMTLQSGFTVINRQQQQNASQLNIGDIGSASNADADVNISHAAKHPIVAQYLDISHFEQQASMPLATNKKRPRVTPFSASPASKQVIDTGKKRSASAPLPKPAKKVKRSRSSDDGHATVSASKTTTMSKRNSASAPGPESNKENAIPYNSGLELEALPSEGLALSQQIAQKLKAWKFQTSPSSSGIIESTAQSDSNTDHQTDSRSLLTSSTVTPVQRSVRASSTVGFESNTDHPTGSRPLSTSSTVTPGTPATSVSQVVHFTPLRSSSAESLSLLSPVTSLDVIKSSQGYGHSIYDSTPPSSSNNRLTTAKPHPEPQPALAPSRLPPPTNGHHVLETIFEESPPSSIERVGELPGPVPGSSVTPICNSTESSSTGEVNLNDPFADDVFDDLDDGDLLDLEFSFEATTPAPKRVPRNSLPTSQAVQHVPPAIRRNVDPDIIEIVSDDDWNILEDEEVAFMDFTGDMALTAAPASTSKTCDRGRLNPAKVSIANSPHGTEMAQSQSTTPQQNQTSPQVPASTAAEATEDCLNAILHPPIIRPPFPKPIHDRSPLIGVSASLVLKTCFRVGECLNTGCTFARNSNTQSSDTILLELYAKVVSSHRDDNGVTQHFVLADLFHEKRGPFLNATCETWKGSELWEYDCGRFLFADSSDEKQICRAVGRMKREGGKWRFVVLNIWEATWEDVEFVRGIICGV